MIAMQLLQKGCDWYRGIDHVFTTRSITAIDVIDGIGGARLTGIPPARQERKDSRLPEHYRSEENTGFTSSKSLSKIIAMQ